MKKSANFRSADNLGIVTNPNNRDIFNKYLNDVRPYKPLSREEELIIFKELKLTNDQKLKDKISKHNLLFVIAVAKKYSMFIKKSNLTLEDLISEGNMGLCIAIERFDYNTGNKFISYAVWYIRQQILKCIQDNIKSMRLPTNLQSTLRKLLKEESLLEQDLSRNVSLTELIDVGIKKGILLQGVQTLNVTNLLDSYQSDKSLSDVLSDDGKTEFWETIASEDANPLETYEKKELSNNLFELMDRVRMPEHIKRYITDYYGLFDTKPLTYKEIGEKYETTAGAVKVRMDKWLRRMRYRNRDNWKYFRYK